MDNSDTAQETQNGQVSPSSVAPDYNASGDLYIACGLSYPLTEPKSHWRISCGLCMPKHVAGLQRKTVKATGLKSSEEQETTFGTGLRWQSQQDRTKEEDNYIIFSWIVLNAKITQRHQFMALSHNQF